MAQNNIGGVGVDSDEKSAEIWVIVCLLARAAPKYRKKNFVTIQNSISPVKTQQIDKFKSEKKNQRGASAAVNISCCRSGEMQRFSFKKKHLPRRLDLGKPRIQITKLSLKPRYVSLRLCCDAWYFGRRCRLRCAGFEVQLLTHVALKHCKKNRVVGFVALEGHTWYFFYFRLQNRVRLARIADR